MSAEDFAPLKTLGRAKKALRAKYAVACPVCVNRLPKAHPTMLLPQERCKMHGYRDGRNRLTDAQVDEVFNQFGIHMDRS